MVNAVIGQKKGMRQVWTKLGVRYPVTEVVMKGNVVVRSIGQAVDTNDTKRFQIAFGDKKIKNVPQPTAKQLEQAGILPGKRIFKEVETQVELKPGQEIKVEDVFEVGDVIKVTGTSKGKGFAGVVKRWGFKGGPRTHGQSDRQRAPGSIGQGTTPGRVYKNKKMPGHMGVQSKTLLTAVILAIDPEKQTIWIKGSLPGSYNGFLTLYKGTDQNLIELNETSLSQLLDIKPQSVPAEEENAEEAPAENVEEAPAEIVEEATESTPKEDAPAKAEEAQA